MVQKREDRERGGFSKVYVSLKERVRENPKVATIVVVFVVFSLILAVV